LDEEYRQLKNELEQKTAEATKLKNKTKKLKQEIENNPNYKKEKEEVKLELQISEKKFENMKHENEDLSLKI
jgi:hypothetical protein